MEPPKKVIVARFFRLGSGREPVRDWLLTLPSNDRKVIGQDIMKVEYGWPCGLPLCESLKGYPGLYEVRSSLSDRRIARVFFTVSGGMMVLLHGFVKKTQATPDKELKLAMRRLKAYNRDA